MKRTRIGARLGRQTQGEDIMDTDPKQGDIVHFEINTRDPQRAKKFYSSV